MIGKGLEGVKFVIVRFGVGGKTSETAVGNQREQPAKGAESIIIKFYCGLHRTESCSGAVESEI